MLDLEIRRDFLDAKARGDWNKCVDLAEAISVQAAPSETAMIGLFAAEAMALLAGMPGLCPTELFSAVKASPDDVVLWEMFKQTAMDVRNVGLLGYAYRMRIDWAKDDAERAVRTLEFGHYLRFHAAAHREAVQAYVEVIHLDESLEVACLVALHQLYREDPLCEAAADAIRALCAAMEVSRTVMDAQKAHLAETDAVDVDERARTMIRLARLTFLLWGDIGRGMEMAAAAFAVSACVREEAVVLIRGLGLAMPDNMAVLDHCLLNLEELGDWKDALALGHGLLKLSKNGSSRLRTALRLTKDATRVDGADAEAAYFFQKAYSADPEAWLVEVEHADWILKYAFSSPLFAETLMSLLAQCGARKQYMDVRTALAGGVAGNKKSAALHVLNIQADASQKDDPLHILQDQKERTVETKKTSSGISGLRLPLPSVRVNKEDSQRQSPIEGKPDETWKFVVGEFLKYVPYSLSWSARCPGGADIVQTFASPDQAYPILLDAINEMIENQGFFMQVATMNDNQNQQLQYMAKLDEMIAMYAADTAKKNGLLEKKYQVASILGDDRARIVCLKDMLESEPENAFAIEHVWSLDENTLKPHAQIMLCQLRVMLNEDPEQNYALRSHLAELYGRTSQYNNAINLYRALIDEKPDVLEPRYCLIDLLIQLENWKSVENVMLSLVNIETDDHRRFDALVRLAKIQDEKMMMPSRALLTLFAAIDIIPDIPVLHDLLCQISERIHSYSPLIDKYEELARHSPNKDVRCQATARLARLYVDKLNQPAAAADILNDLYDHGGSEDLEFMRSMVPICRELELWNDYVRVLLRIVEISADKREVVRSLLDVAQVYAIEPCNHDQAIAFAKRASLMEPDNGDDWGVIADIMLIRKEYQDAMRALQKALKYQDGFERARTLLKMAQINSDLEDLIEATKLFHQAAQLGAPLEDLLPVAEHLIFLATMQHSQTAFETLCNDLIVASPEEERAELLLQQAMTLARVFDDLDSARRIISVLKPHFAEFDLAQNCVLADIFTLLHEEQTAIELNFKIIRSNELSEKQRFQRLQAMLVNATQIEDTALIKNVCTAIMEHDPDDLNANYNLIRLDYNAGRWDVAVNRIQRFISVADRLNAESAMHLYYYYADILHAAQHDNLALENLNRALAIRSDFKAAVDLKLTIYLEHEHWREALPSFKVLLSLSQDDDERGAIHKRIAEVWHFYLNDPEKAIQEYEQALTLGGDVEDVPIRLLELYRAQGLWQKAAITAQVLAQAQTSSEEARLEYLRVLGDIWENHLDEPTLAENTYQEMFESAPLREDVVRALVRVLIAQKKYDALNRISERLIVVSKREFEAGMAMFAVLFGLSCRILQARPVLQSILVRLNDVFPGQRAVNALTQYLDVPVENVVIESERTKTSVSDDAIPVVPMPPQTRARKQTMPSLGTSLTVDSGVLNPNFDSGLIRRPTADSSHNLGDSGFGRRAASDSLVISNEAGKRPSTDSLRRADESGLGKRPSTDSLRRTDESEPGLHTATDPLKRSNSGSGLLGRPITDTLKRNDSVALGKTSALGSANAFDAKNEGLRLTKDSGLLRRPDTQSLSQKLPKLNPKASTSQTQKLSLPENRSTAYARINMSESTSSEITKRTKREDIENQHTAADARSSDTVRRRIDTLKETSTAAQPSMPDTQPRYAYTKPVETPEELPILSPSAIIPVVSDEGLPLIEADDVLIPLKK